MGTHSNIARAVRDKEADYILAVKDNQPKLAESVMTFFEIGQGGRLEAHAAHLRGIGREESRAPGGAALLGV